MAVGYSLSEVVRMTTANASAAVGLQDEAGALAVGRPADITIMDVVEDDFEFADTTGKALFGRSRLAPGMAAEGCTAAGEWSMTAYVANDSWEQLPVKHFDLDGGYREQWTDVTRPSGLAVDADGHVYVAELWRPKDKKSFVHGTAYIEQPGRVSVFDSEGRLLNRFAGLSTARMQRATSSPPTRSPSTRPATSTSAKSRIRSLSSLAGCRTITRATSCRSFPEQSEDDVEVQH